MSFEIKCENEVLSLTLSGELVKVDVASLTEKLLEQIKGKEVRSIFLRGEQVQKWDTSALAVIYAIINQFPRSHIQIEQLPTGLKRLIQLAMADHRFPTQSDMLRESFFNRLGSFVLNMLGHIQTGFEFLSEVWASIKRLFQGTAVVRAVDFWRALDDCAPKAVGIVSLISVMVGLILAFVGAIQLKSFGAQVYVASLVTIGMIRIMGAIMIGIIMAGRTGASYAASIGTMQVNEELDALKTMGISRMDFLVLPRLGALVMAMPFLVILSDFMGMLGGGLVGVGMLDISLEEYWTYTVDAFDIKNFSIGIFHGIVYGFVVALCGCYFGIKCGRDSGSVGIATTKAVVYSIVWMIVMTGILTLICEVIGI